MQVAEEDEVEVTSNTLAAVPVPLHESVKSVKIW